MIATEPAVDTYFCFPRPNNYSVLTREQKTAPNEILAVPFPQDKENYGSEHRTKKMY
ncbi:hypothetical protein SAMN05421787_108134 [Virgibacillus pantothenticus]|nr:hypothetical protein SAMN05421787_108134 [Virgibacillus pantothenticus]